MRRAFVIVWKDGQVKIALWLLVLTIVIVRGSVI